MCVFCIALMVFGLIPWFSYAMTTVILERRDKTNYDYLNHNITMNILHEYKIYILT